MTTAKQDVEKLLHKLSEQHSRGHPIQFYLLDKVRYALEAARLNGTLSQEEVESCLSKWLKRVVSSPPGH